MKITQTRKMTTSIIGPSVSEMKEFLDGVDPCNRIKVQVNQGDLREPGEMIFTVEVGVLSTDNDTSRNNWNSER